MSIYRFGKHPVKHDYRTLRLKNYLGTKTADMAAPPAQYDVLKLVHDKLGSAQNGDLFPIDGNDIYGDCTIAALAHAVTINRALASNEKKIMTAQAVERLYFRLSGGVDSGLVELDVLNYWRKHKVAGDSLLAYASIEPKNHTHIKQAIHAFRGVYLGFQCQKNCVEDFQAQKPWTPGKLTNDGHAVYAVGYDKDGVTVLTWGGTQRGTWAWWDECVDEAYALIPTEAKDPDFSPGFNLAQLKADLAQLTDPD